MILNKTIKIRVHNTLLKHYQSLGYFCKIGDIIEISPLDLTNSSKIKLNVKCDICGKEKELSCEKYNKNIKNQGFYCCSQKCARIKNKKTSLERYNNENFNNREKCKETCIDKYGVENVMQNEEIKEKNFNTIEQKYGNKILMSNQIIKEKVKQTKINIYGEDYGKIISKKAEETKDLLYNDKNYNNREKCKETCVDKYGVENVMQNKSIQDKASNTLEQHYGIKCTFLSEEIKQKIQETNLKRYENIYPSKNDDIKEKIRNTNLKTYDKIIKNNYKKLKIINIDNDRNITIMCEKGHEYIISKNLLKMRKFYNHEYCTICNPINSFSQKETEMGDFIFQNYDGEILRNKRIVLDNEYELDIYLPELKLAFEFNGLYWHCELNKEKNYHKNKSDLCNKKGIQLIHIWEDDWNLKLDIVKSVILNKLGKTENKIFARKCEIKELSDNIIVKKFLNDNHIQGSIGSFIKIGLYYNNELVSLMTFGKKRKFMNCSSKEGEWELLRFCNKLNTNVIGSASKLFKYFIKNYIYSDITTYADRSYSNGKLYDILGFEFVNKTEPNYYYIVNGVRKHRFAFRKDALIKEGFDSNKTEHQIMLDRGINRIFNAGNLKFSFIKKI